jgi:PP-loop superfamily ATP-utilizing enzyme
MTPDTRMSSPPKMCRQCVLTTAVPGVSLDPEGVCNVCREYEQRRTIYDGYFRSERDLLQLRESAVCKNAETQVLLLFSGGKDSTYVLYRLVDLGFRVLTFTFDNGYIPERCFKNIREVCGQLGVPNVTRNVGREAMDAVFRISLDRDATVCSGCFRGLTARSTELAVAQRIPIVVTGLSRGQIFHTKVHQLLNAGVAEPARIDSYLRDFRRAYHSANDEIAQHLDDRALNDPDAFERTQFLDFFRYSAVTKPQIMALIRERAAFWQRPDHVGGCSTNCMINDVGIEAHQRRNGYHNYAVPLAWDVRFGHLRRADAISELESTIDTTRTSRIIRHLKASAAEETAD